MRALPILVVKVGTSTLLTRSERPSKTFDYVAESIRDLRVTYRIVLVTSGAIGFGVTQLGLEDRPETPAELQALSMMGQVGLLRRWREAFGDVAIGQVLVTRRDLERDSTAMLFRQSVEAVWRYGAIPIVNENDAVSTEEISFGDNDRLAAEVATEMKAIRLILLTDQDGIMEHFGTDAARRLEKISLEEAAKHIRSTKTTLGTGGARSKLTAARVALRGGVKVVIAHAATPRAIESSLSGKAGTNIVE